MPNYYETIQNSASAEGRFVRQAGCPGHFAVVTLRVEPLPGVGKVICESEIVPEINAVDDWDSSTIPAEYIPAVYAGIERAAKVGPTHGYPVIGVRVTLTGGLYHPVDSRPASFEEAGARAFIEALRRAGTVVVES